MAYQEFDAAGHMRAFADYERVVDVTEELFGMTWWRGRTDDLLVDTVF